jgi:hypothetical protein
MNSQLHIPEDSRVKTTIAILMFWAVPLAALRLSGASVVANRVNGQEFLLGRRDVHEHAVGVGGQRMDIGRMALELHGKMLSVSMRNDLWNAEVGGNIKTDLGEIRFRALCNAGPWFRVNQWPQIWWNPNVQIAEIIRTT